MWEYQAVQHALDAVEFRVVPAERVELAFVRDLERRLEDLLAPGTCVRVELTETIARDPSGKRPVIESRVVGAAASAPPERPATGADGNRA